VPRRKKYQTCDWETYQDCYQVPGQDDCQYVAKQQCYGRGNSVKGAKCNEQPKQDCREVHKEVPYQVERRVCPGDSDWDDVRDNVGGSFSAGTIANAFNQATGGNSEIEEEADPNEAFNQATRNDNDNNVDEIALKSTGGNSEIEEEADPNEAFNQATGNDNDNNVGGREVIPGVRNDDILGIIDEIALKSTGGNSEIEEEADPNDDTIVFD